MGSIYTSGSFEEKRTEREETTKKSEDLEGTIKEGATRCNKSSVGDYLCASAYVSIELVLLKSGLVV